MRYAVSDIHGCARTFRALVRERIELNKESDELYLLGDYVDRGPDSKGVLDFITELQQEGFNLKVIRGNHDQLILDSLHSEASMATWTMNGGTSTLLSFDAEGPGQIPVKYLNQIRQMKYFEEVEDAFLVHAGFNFKSPNVFSDYESMMYIRQMNIDNSQIHYKKIIHGHTPTPLCRIREMVALGQQEINIDNGCVFGAVEEYGTLVALELNKMRIITQPHID